MSLVGARLAAVEDGRVEIRVGIRPAEVLRMSRATAVSHATAYAVAGGAVTRAAVATSLLRHFPAGEQ